MRVAIVTFEAFNEIDSFVALNIISRLRRHRLKVRIVSPANGATSMNGVRVVGAGPLEAANDADAVLLGRGRLTSQIAEDDALMSRFRLNPARQLIASQYSGALLLTRLGLLPSRKACTDHKTRPLLHREGIEVLNKPFVASGTVASAGAAKDARR